MKQRLLVSVRGKEESVNAITGGAHIADVEYPESALGTPYPLNISSVRKVLQKRILVSTNIGEEQLKRSTACQAALGVALAGADIIKAGLAGLKYNDAEYLGRSIVRTVKKWFPNKQVIPAFFADPKLSKKFNPLTQGPQLAKVIKADGVLIDTFNKKRGKCLLDYISLKEIEKFANACHKNRLEAWIAGSITKAQLPKLWKTGIDVVCVRSAACEGRGRFGKVSSKIVAELVATIPT